MPFILITIVWSHYCLSYLMKYNVIIHVVYFKQKMCRHFYYMYIMYMNNKIIYKVNNYFWWNIQYKNIIFFNNQGVRVMVMVFNTTFNNISVILWQSVLLVEETGVPRESHRPAASHWQTLSHNVASSTPCLNGIQTQC